MIGRLWATLGPQYGLVVAAGLVAALFAVSLPALWHAWWDTGTFNHCLIVLPAAAWLIREQERAAPTVAVSPWRWRYLPAGLLVDLAILWLAGRLLGLQVVEQAALVAMVPTLAWAWNGHDWAKRHRFALLFCLLATPVGEFLVPHLMELTADLTVLLVKLCGIPVLRDGMRLSLASGDFIVAEACSGIRYLIASVTLGLLFAHLTYRTLRRKLWFMVAAVVVPLLANGLRAWMMVMIAHFSDLEYATGFDHLVYGWLFFGVVMVILFGVGSLFIEPAAPVPATAVSASAAPIPAAATRWRSLAVPVLLLVWAPLAALAAQRHVESIDGALPPHAFPAALAGYRLVGPAEFPTPLVYPGADRIDAALYRRVVPGAAPEELHYAVVRFVRDRPGHEFVTQVNRPWNEDWHRDTSGEAVFAGALRHVDDLRPKPEDLTDVPGRPWRVYSWYAAAGETTTQAWRAKWLGLRDWFTSRESTPEPTIHLVAIPR